MQSRDDQKFYSSCTPLPTGIPEDYHSSGVFNYFPHFTDSNFGETIDIPNPGSNWIVVHTTPLEISSLTLSIKFSIIYNI